MAGRKSRQRALSVWVNGALAGEWRMPARGDMEFQYHPDWVASDTGRPLSLSLPFTLDHAPVKGPEVGNYFDNLLPDADAIRRRMQERFHAASRGPFDLLAQVGRDCVGAVQLLPEGEAPADIHTIAATPLTDEDIERDLVEAVSPSTAATRQADDHFRISIAGAQEKTAFLRHQGRWCRPLGSTPSTHIFKLPMGLIGGARIDMTASVENEWLCGKILAAYGLPVARSEIAQFGTRFGAQKVLVVERFDRQLHSSGTHWLRLVQEDFCQATGRPASQKYEADGGPGLEDIAQVLRGSVQRDRDLACVFKAQLIFWLLAACDGHAKNFSIRILEQGRYQLTPLYDVLSFWPIIGAGAGNIPRQNARLAMAVRGRNKHYLLDEVQRRHFTATAARCGLGGGGEALVGEVLAATPGVIAAVQRDAPRGFPQQVLDAVLQGLERSAARLGAMAVG